jgi:hypothetical protein
VAWSSWPSTDHNSGDLDDNEYEKIAVPYLANGVIGGPADISLVYGDSSGRQVKTRGGRYVAVRGRLGSSGATDTTLSVTANSSGSTRIDLVVARVDRADNYNITPVVKPGTPGSGPPSTQVDVGTTGKYEIPLAEVTVINGATTITAADVKNVAWYTAPPPVTALSADKLPPHLAGLRAWLLDSKTWVTSDGSSWSSDVTDTGWKDFTPGTGWNVASAGCRVRARGGFASLICEVSRVGALGANVDSVVATLDTPYKPGPTSGLGFPLIAWVNGQLGLGVVKPSGQIILANSPALATGGLVEFHGATWPIG